jgi:hypothetical protein
LNETPIAQEIWARIDKCNKFKSFRTSHKGNANQTH